MRQKLTVLIPCRNEERHIRACIESARPIADEVLVADSGSTDRTLEIVERLGGCRLIQREWVGYADFKNWAIPQAAYPWILAVDADERVTPELASEIRDTLAAPPNSIDAYRIGFLAYFMGVPVPHSPLSHATYRLFRRDVCRYRDRKVHESILVGRRRAGVLTHKFLHHSITSYDEYLEKYSRYTKWGAEEVWARGGRPGFAGLLVRPALRFLYLYVLRGGFRDGLPGLQVCALTSFFNTFMKQARLWEMQRQTQRHLATQEAVEPPHSIWPVFEAGLPSSRPVAARESATLIPAADLPRAG